MTNCPNCGKKKEVSGKDMLLALFVEFGGRTNHSFDYCECEKGITPPQFITGNWLTHDRAIRKGGIWVDIWHTHNLPKMRDCRDLNYKYAVVGERVICEALGDYYNITDEVESDIEIST